jgi:hypothetical protein
MLTFTVGAHASPFLEQVFSDLVACEFSLLILNSRGLGVLHQLSVEANQLLAERSGGAEPPHAIDPGQHILDAARQRRREPAVTTPPVVEARLSIASMSLPSAATDRSPRQEAIANLLAAMGELRRPDNVTVSIIDYGQASRLTARINLDPQRFLLGIGHSPFENNREGVPAKDCRFPFGQQSARMTRVNWIKRALLAVEHKHGRHEMIVSFRTSAYAGNGFLAKVIERFLTGSTGCNPVCLFNHRP